MNEKERNQETIERLKEIQRNDGWGHIPTIGESEGWMGNEN
jgi:hypothetical protein